MATETRLPTTVVIIGASGDLTRRKLIPALFHLGSKGRLPPGLRIVGYSRTDFSEDAFREYMWEGARDLGDLDVHREEWDRFARCIHYLRGDAASASDMGRLKEYLEELDRGASGSNRLFNLAIAPHLYEGVVRTLESAGLAAGNGGWSRVIIEKPFGRDLDSAAELNRVVGSVFSEDQVYRIDHYLGKETVQNLMALRFANTIFEPLWNRNYVDNVQITVAEEVSVGDRGAYYDQSGVVRDMVQNHLLQLLAMVAMEPPSARHPESLRDKKVEVLRSIRPLGVHGAPGDAVRGQYRGYTGEKGVPEGSPTATYAALRLFVDNWRWQGVPFYLRTGKAMAAKVSEVDIQFKSPPHVTFSLGAPEDLPSNILAVCIQPDEGAHLMVEAKVPDQGSYQDPDRGPDRGRDRGPDRGMRLRTVDLEFNYASAFGGMSIPEAYERLLQDALEGDSRLFIRSDHIEEAWRLVDPLLRAWEDPNGTPMHVYEPGSWGPAAADHLLARDGRRWVQACGCHR